MHKLWIVGPCALESEKMFLEVGEALVEIMNGHLWYFKASFDKANRTSIGGRRGIGLENGIEILHKFKEKHPSIRLTTDVHECWQVEKLKAVIDVIQIPAFLCRQTDLLIECGKHFDIVNIKKGQWIAPDSSKHFVGKVRSQNPNAQVWITERGTSFGYDHLIVDHAAADELNDYFDKVILDCTHSTQRKKGDFTGGDRTLAERHLIGSVAYKYNGIFAEVHPDPPTAISDSDCQIYLKRLPKLISLHDELFRTCAVADLWDDYGR